MPPEVLQGSKASPPTLADVDCSTPSPCSRPTLQPLQRSLLAAHDNQSLIYQFYSVAFVQDPRRTGREGVATGGVHVAACKVTPYERRTIRGRKRPLEARARTRAAGKRDVDEHGGSFSFARFSRHLGQRQALGAHHEVHGLGRD